MMTIVAGLRRGHQVCRRRTGNPLSALARPFGRAGGSVLGGASALFGTTVVTSLLGFVFWVVAARLSPPVAVGSAAAAISAMQLIGSLATLGLGTLLIGELARRADDTVRLVGASTVVSGATAFAAATIVGSVLAIAAPMATPLFNGPANLTLFALGTSATTVSVVLDQALIGLARGGRQLVRNAVFATSKLALLPIFAAWHRLSATELYGVWLLGNLLSLVLLLAGSSDPGAWLRTPPRPRALRGLVGKAAAHNWTNVAAYAPMLMLPLVVVRSLGPAGNAAFYAALLLASFVWIIPTHLSTALFAVAAHDGDTLRRELRLSLRISFCVWVAAGLGLWAVGRSLLHLFGPEYTRAGLGLALLGLATFPSAVKSLYVAVRRVQGRLNTAARVTVAGSSAEIAAGIVGVKWGITGVCGALSATMAVEALLLWPRVAGAAGYLPGRTALLRRPKHPSARLAARRSGG
jgi:O-antigen/teichoic acid export membrane protein